MSLCTPDTLSHNSTIFDSYLCPGCPILSRADWLVEQEKRVSSKYDLAPPLIHLDFFCLCLKEKKHWNTLWLLWSVAVSFGEAFSEIVLLASLKPVCSFFQEHFITVWNCLHISHGLLQPLNFFFLILSSIIFEKCFEIISLPLFEFHHYLIFSSSLGFCFKFLVLAFCSFQSCMSLLLSLPLFVLLPDFCLVFDCELFAFSSSFHKTIRMSDADFCCSQCTLISVVFLYWNSTMLLS